MAQQFVSLEACSRMEIYKVSIVKVTMTFWVLGQVFDTGTTPGVLHPLVHEMPVQSRHKAKLGNNTNSNFQS